MPTAPTADESPGERDLHPHEHALPDETHRAAGDADVSDTGGDSDPGASTAD